eukprot:403332128
MLTTQNQSATNSSSSMNQNREAVVNSFMDKLQSTLDQTLKAQSIYYNFDFESCTPTSDTTNNKSESVDWNQSQESYRQSNSSSGITPQNPHNDLDDISLQIVNFGQLANAQKTSSSAKKINFPSFTWSKIPSCHKSNPQNLKQSEELISQNIIEKNNISQPPYQKQNKYGQLQKKYLQKMIEEEKLISLNNLENQNLVKQEACTSDSELIFHVDLSELSQSSQQQEMSDDPKETQQQNQFRLFEGSNSELNKLNQNLRNLSNQRGSGQKFGKFQTNTNIPTITSSYQITSNVSSVFLSKLSLNNEPLQEQPKIRTPIWRFSPKQNLNFESIGCNLGKRKVSFGSNYNEYKLEQVNYNSQHKRQNTQFFDQNQFSNQNDQRDDSLRRQVENTQKRQRIGAYQSDLSISTNQTGLSNNLGRDSFQKQPKIGNYQTSNICEVNLKSYQTNRVNQYEDMLMNSENGSSQQSIQIQRDEITVIDFENLRIGGLTNKNMETQATNQIETFSALINFQNSCDAAIANQYVEIDEGNTQPNKSQIE